MAIKIPDKCPWCASPIRYLVNDKVYWTCGSSVIMGKEIKTVRAMECEFATEHRLEHCPTNCGCCG